MTSTHDLPPLGNPAPRTASPTGDVRVDIGPPLVKSTESATASAGDHKPFDKTDRNGYVVDSDVGAGRDEKNNDDVGSDVVIADVQSASKPTARQIVLGLGSACLKGLAFGFALEKGRVFEPRVIVAQMRFEQWLMFKMFLSAVTVSLMVLALLSAVPATKGYFQRSRDVFGYTRGWPVVAIGAFILGAGMTIAGACPGTWPGVHNLISFFFFFIKWARQMHA
jgi:uncharacterized membrane protein YedE/YeeE